MDKGKSVPNSQIKDTREVEFEKIVDLLTCAICKKIFREATTINICLHTFCKNCIYRKFQEEESKCCPVCNKDLGSSPEQFLRADELWNNIARKFFPPRNSRRNNATSATSKLRNKRPEVTNACATRTKAMPQDTCMLQKTKRKFDDGSHVAGIRGQLDRISSHGISHYQSTVSKEKKISTMMPEVTCNASEHNPHKDFSETETQSKVQRKKRTTRGISRSSSSSQKKDKEKIEHKNVEISSDGAYGFMDSGESYHKTSSEEELPDKENVITIWLSLSPCENEDGHIYPQLPGPYCPVKNERNFRVLHIQRFVKERLGLESEYEVEIMYNGQHLDPSLLARSMVDFWIDKLEENDYVIHLEYKKSINFEAPKQN